MLVYFAKHKHIEQSELNVTHTAIKRAHACWFQLSWWYVLADCHAFVSVILDMYKLPYLQYVPVPDMYNLYWRHKQAQATLLSRCRVCAPSVSMLEELQISVCQHHTHVPLGYCSTQPDRVWHEQMVI